MDLIASAALVGAISGALLGQTANRAVNLGIDAIATTGNVTYHALQGTLKSTTNPNIIAVLNQLEAMDIDSKLLTVNAMVESLETKMGASDDVVKLALDQVRAAIPPIKESLIAVHAELQHHEQRHMAHWRSPHTDDLVDALGRKLAILDQRMDILVKLTAMRSPLERS
jgi:hypothetical protein